MPSPVSNRFTAQQHQILNRWRDVLDDIRHLCESLEALPEMCVCGDGRAHLRGSCRCCRSERVGKGLPPCEDCESLLDALQPRVNQLTVDTWQFFPSALDLLSLRGQQSGKVRAGSARERHIAAVAREEAITASERDIVAIIHTFDRLVAAVDEFRVGCRASHLQRLKALASALLAELEGFDRSLSKPGTD